MKKFFTGEKIKAVFIIIPILYVFTYFSVLSNSSFAVAKRFAETNTAITNEIGAIKWVIPAFLGGAVERNGNAYYTMYVMGTRKGGEILIRLTLKDQEWTVLSAAYVSNENEVLILMKDEKP